MSDLPNEVKFAAARRQGLAAEVARLHQECGQASRELAEQMLLVYEEYSVTLAHLARMINMQPDDFRALMWKYIGKERLKEARAIRGKGNHD